MHDRYQYNRSPDSVLHEQDRYQYYWSFVFMLNMHDRYPSTIGCLTPCCTCRAAISSSYIYRSSDFTLNRYKYYRSFDFKCWTYRTAIRVLYVF